MSRTQRGTWTQEVQIPYQIIKDTIILYINKIESYVDTEALSKEESDNIKKFLTVEKLRVFMQQPHSPVITTDHQSNTEVLTKKEHIEQIIGHYINEKTGWRISISHAGNETGSPVEMTKNEEAESYYTCTLPAV